MALVAPTPTVKTQEQARELMGQTAEAKRARQEAIQANKRQRKRNEEILFARRAVRGELRHEGQEAKRLAEEADPGQERLRALAEEEVVKPPEVSHGLSPFAEPVQAYYRQLNPRQSGGLAYLFAPLALALLGCWVLLESAL